MTRKSNIEHYENIFSALECDIIDLQAALDEHRQCLKADFGFAKRKDIQLLVRAMRRVGASLDEIETANTEWLVRNESRD